VCKDDSH